VNREHVVNLLDMNQPTLAQFFAHLGEKPASVNMRARQTLKWLHQAQLSDIAGMTDIAKATREQIAAHAEIRDLAVLHDHRSDDGTRKWLFDVGSSAIDAVFIPEDDRGTLCISSQAGCALDCSFCSTGKQGFNRNLTVGEIIGQLRHANRALKADRAIHGRTADGVQPITNVVMMGMGEPLQNYAALVPALRMMLDDHGYGLSRRRVTVSTSGMVSMIERLRDDCPVALAVSLHAANDALRDELVPLNRKHRLADLMRACHHYLERAPRDFITFEYCMLDGVNDSDAHAREVIELVAGRGPAAAPGLRIPCKINLIPFNPFPQSGLRRSPDARVQAFARVLQAAGLVTTVRKTRGDDIDAACGQLAGEVRDRTQVRVRLQRRREAEPLAAPVAAVAQAAQGAAR